MPARLHTERIARSDAHPEHWLVMTHGIFGAGSNWRGIARKLVERRREYGVLLVDLRLHGKSDPGERPHTVAAAAADLAATVEEQRRDIAIRALAGHSFGGKTALATRQLIDLDQTWVLDASPSARREAMTDPDNSVLRVLEMMARMPASWPSREAFVAAVQAEGHETGLAQWLAMNLIPQDDGALVNRLDVEALRELLADYYQVDLWAAVEAPRGDLELVIAMRGNTVSAADRERLASPPPHVHVHEIEAGHWLHIEAPAQVVELFAARLP